MILAWALGLARLRPLVRPSRASAPRLVVPLKPVRAAPKSTVGWANPRPLGMPSLALGIGRAMPRPLARFGRALSVGQAMLWSRVRPGLPLAVGRAMPWPLARLNPALAVGRPQPRPRARLQLAPGQAIAQAPTKHNHASALGQARSPLYTPVVLPLARRPTTQAQERRATLTRHVLLRWRCTPPGPLLVHLAVVAGHTTQVLPVSSQPQWQPRRHMPIASPPASQVRVWERVMPMLASFQPRQHQSRMLAPSSPRWPGERPQPATAACLEMATRRQAATDSRAAAAPPQAAPP
mmetsp:Transcript_48775/g.155967  ORF Transcript_48775/g.155967 Transcript_48775/m.155967 type:complete len:294 (+) Transcript_48775:541-1422(+)